MTEQQDAGMLPGMLRMVMKERDELKSRLAAAEAALSEASEKLAHWHEAMTDVSIVNWTLSEENKEDLYKQLIAVIDQNVQVQLDPTVSEQARALSEARAVLEYALSPEPKPASVEHWLDGIRRRARVALAALSRAATETTVTTA